MKWSCLGSVALVCLTVVLATAGAAWMVGDFKRSLRGWVPDLVDAVTGRSGGDTPHGEEWGVRHRVDSDLCRVVKGPPELLATGTTTGNPSSKDRRLEEVADAVRDHPFSVGRLIVIREGKTFPEREERARFEDRVREALRSRGEGEVTVICRWEVLPWPGKE